MINQLIHGNNIKNGKIEVFLPFSHVYISLIGSTVNLNEVSQPISTEYKMVHGLNQVLFRT